jgi:carboxyl-terminal processing protease
MNTKLLDMIKKNLIYIIPIILALAGFALLPSNKSIEPLTPASSTPEFVLEVSINDTIKVLKPERKNIQETILVTELLKAYHYRKLPLDDSLSDVIYHNYLSSLDNSKLYFMKNDINSFDKYRFYLDNYLLEGNLDAAYQIFAVFQERTYQRLAIIREMLSANKFDFTLDEEFVFDREDLDWLNSEQELDDVWRKYIKNQLLSLKISGKTTEEAIEVLEKRYNRYQTVIQQYNSADVYQVFMNSLTEAYDPHTGYFNPITAENFDIEMSKSLEGIGALLSKDGDYTIVVSVVPGGPAFKGDEIHDNDRIVGVGQGTDGEIVDVVGWRNDDVVQQIRGKKGTTVRLSVLKAKDGVTATPKIVTIVREKINIENARAESKVYNFSHDDGDYKLGVITIPSFYKDFKNARNGNDEFNSTTRDVKKLVADLNEKEVDGIMIDLRRNGGGALDEAIELTGLFIKDGPVVQVKDYNGGTSQEDDNSGSVYYDGPLAVLTSRLSASASEIFAAAIQDYKRGLIVGEQSFGKGTVQNLLGLQRYIPKEKEKLGQLKLTIAKFYRVNGGSTQNVGVTPDLELPSTYDEKTVGESSYPSALPWDQIPSSNFVPMNNIDDNLLALLRKKYSKRKEYDPDLQDLIADTKKMRENQTQKSISLNEEKRRAEQEEEDKRRGAHSKLESELTTSESGANVEPKRLKLKDLYLQESLFVLADMIAYRET